MTADASDTWVAATIAALEPLRDPVRSQPMAAYMKDVSAFLGIPAPARRSAQTSAWKGLPPLGETELAEVCEALWDLPDREYQYAACDLMARQQPLPSAVFVPEVTQGLLTTKPWWDTVDALGSASVAPTVSLNLELVDLMWAWLDSGELWLVRAAVQHQRGLGRRTDIDRLLDMCDRVASDRDFFIAKAVGWALRETSAFAPEAVQHFVDEHPQLSAVARREAVRGLARSARP